MKLYLLLVCSIQHKNIFSTVKADYILKYFMVVYLDHYTNYIPEISHKHRVYGMILYGLVAAEINRFT